MSPPTAAGSVSLPTPALAAEWASVRPLRRAAALVAGFWWLSTGLIFALQRNDLTRTLAFLIFSALAVAAVFVIRATRNDRSPRGVAAAFLAGGALWAWVTNALFGGWLIGPEGVRASGSERTLGLALEAIHATLYAEVAGVVALVLTAWLVRGAHNRMALATITALWGAQQLAKINIFLGVANPGARFLPDRLQFLAEFFGPAETTPVLIGSVVLLGVITVRCGRAAVRGPDPADRFANGVLTALLALAVIEHVVLGLRFDLPLWDLFLSLRGD